MELNQRINTKNVTLASLKLDFELVTQQIDDYLQQIEFYVSEPDPAYLKQLQAKRYDIKKEILLRESILNPIGPDPVLPQPIVVSHKSNTRTPNLPAELKPNKNSKVSTNSVPTNANSTQPNESYERLTKRCNQLENTVAGLREALNRERKIRTQQDEHADRARQQIVRVLYEMNPEHPNVSWAAELIKSNPNWGLTNA